MSGQASTRRLRERPCVYTIPAGVSFVDALAQGLLARHRDPLELADLRILMPNRRSAEALEAAFLRHAETESLVLPHVSVLGDLEEEVLEATLARAEDRLVLTPAAGDIERLALLAPLVARFLERTGRTHPAGAEIHALASALARLADTLALADAQLEGLQEIVPEELSAHWQKTAQFLWILQKFWPQVLAERGRIDPGRRQVLLLRALREAWQKTPPGFPVIAAGSTGSVPATADLLAVVARLPEGAVILPAFDREMDEAACCALVEDERLTHPQYQMARLLRHMGCAPHEVRDWPVPMVAQARKRRVHQARLAVLRAALDPDRIAVPPEETRRAALEGLCLLACRDRREEALAAALLLRETLEEPGRTAALVTADRALADAVHAELARWGMTVDDSAGRRLSTTPIGGLAALVLEVIAEDFAPVPLLALLKHPLVRIGEEEGSLRAFARRLDSHRLGENYLLRGPRVAGGLDGLIREARRLKLAKDDLSRLLRLKERLSPLLKAAAEGRRDRRPLARWVKAHVAVMEALAADPSGSTKTLWMHESGEAAAHLFAELLAVDTAAAAFDFDQYRGFIGGLLAETTVRRPYGGHPRLKILGTIEARLLQPDRLILAGLNEGSWPPALPVDPWLNRRMRAAIGLAQPERRIGQSAHDFYTAAAAPEVFLLRAEKIDGVQTTPARWLQRLAVALPELTARAHDHPILATLRRLDRPPRISPCAPPAPAPRAELRPRKISVTAVEMLMRDPYSFYARHILKLRPLEELDADPDAGTRGVLLHAVLHRYLAERLTREPGNLEDELARLQEIGAELFAPFEMRPKVRAVWWPRFENIARAFLRRLEEDEAAGRTPVLLEREGRITLLNGRIELTAKADRIDRLPESGAGAAFAVIDYKTGTVPAAKRMEAGFAPQLPLEGWILERGGFFCEDETPLEGEARELVFWKLKGYGAEPLEVKPIKDAPGCIAEAAARAPEFLASYLLGAHPFHPAPHAQFKVNDEYRHLVREQEWLFALQENAGREDEP